MPSWGVGELALRGFVLFLLGNHIPFRKKKVSSACEFQTRVQGSFLGIRWPEKTILVFLKFKRELLDCWYWGWICQHFPFWEPVGRAVIWGESSRQLSFFEVQMGTLTSSSAEMSKQREVRRVLVPKRGSASEMVDSQLFMLIAFGVRFGSPCPRCVVDHFVDQQRKWAEGFTRRPSCSKFLIRLFRFDSAAGFSRENPYTHVYCILLFWWGMFNLQQISCYWMDWCFQFLDTSNFNW